MLSPQIRFKVISLCTREMEVVLLPGYPDLGVYEHFRVIGKSFCTVADAVEKKAEWSRCS